MYKYHMHMHEYLQRERQLRVLELASKSRLSQAGDAGSIAEDPFNCDVISQEEGAVQQLILMALSDNEIVVEQACKTISLFP